MPLTTVSPLAAVLWDMDGTLVDTEPYWIAAEIELSAEHGGSWDSSLALDLIGRALEDTAEVLRERAGIPLPTEDIIDTLLEKVVSRVMDGGVPWRPGAAELLHGLRAQNVPCALVTMSWRRLADVVLEVLPEGTFTTVVTGDQVTHGKPHPEPYLLAARRLGVDPRHCVAIEDSMPGITSAEAAGVPTVGVEAYIPIPCAPGRSRLLTLEGTSVADLRRIATGEVYDHAGIS